MAVKHPMLEDLAREVGVSRSTVSRALRNRPGVSAKVRARVTRVAEKLRYVPNHFARSLVLGRTDVIGLVTPPILTMTPRDDAMSRIEALAAADGKRIMHLGYDRTECATLASIARQHRWDGLLLFPISRDMANGDLARVLDDFGIPIVVLETAIPGCVDSVTYDRSYGVRLLLDHAAKLGKRRVAVVGLTTEMQNLAGSPKYCHLSDDLKVREMGLAFTVSFESEILHGLPLFRAARKAADRAFENGCDADLVMGSNDTVAVAVMNSLLDRGYRVPEEIAVTGYDDAEWAGYARPALTTIRRPLEEMMELAWSILKRRLEGDESEIRSVTLLPSLVMRSSTRKERGGLG